MQVFLNAIEFNHDRKRWTTGAFSIRQNEAEAITVPEWRSGMTKPESSRVAYAIAATPKIVTIKAKFSCSDPLVTSLKIRALDANTRTYVPLGSRMINVLGDVEECEVMFKAGQSEYVTFELKNVRAAASGVSASDNTWLWQFSADSINWTDFQTTNHRVYTVLDYPQCPWEPKSAEPSNVQVPWAEVLEYACHWAAGLTAPDLVATSLTKRINDLGKTLVVYDAGASYAKAQLELTKFLLLLNSGVGKQTLNCDDCASIVSTFANVLGCDLSQSGMGEVFGTNQILLIGNSYWRPTIFLYHTVAWEGDCLADDSLFDACLQVDGDGRPGLPPQAPIQPAKIQFGTERDRSYRFCLAKSGTCDPIPEHQSYGRRRRRFGSSYLGEGEISDDSFLNRLKEIYSFGEWPSDAVKFFAAGESLSNEFFDKLEFRGWKLESCDHLRNDKFTNIFQVLFRQEAEGSSQLFSVDLYECAASQGPNEFLLQLLGRFEQLNLSRLDNPAIGDISFVKMGGVTVLFRRGRFIAICRSAGRQSVSVVELARTLEQYLLNSFGPSLRDE